MIYGLSIIVAGLTLGVLSLISGTTKRAEWARFGCGALISLLSYYAGKYL